MGWRWFGSQRHPVFCRASALGAEPTPHFLQGGANLYMADPGADPGWNPIFYRSPVHEVHFPEVAPDADPAGEPIFCRQRAPLCPLLKPDPCRIHHACHVSGIGSMRIHVAGP